MGKRYALWGGVCILRKGGGYYISQAINRESSTWKYYDTWWVLNFIYLNLHCKWNETEFKVCFGLKSFVTFLLFKFHKQKINVFNDLTQFEFMVIEMFNRYVSYVERLCIDWQFIVLIYMYIGKILKSLKSALDIC